MREDDGAGRSPVTTKHQVLDHSPTYLVSSIHDTPPAVFLARSRGGAVRVAPLETVGARS